MAQISYRANLSAAIYPMTIAKGGRTVIIPQADQNFDRRLDPVGEQKDAGIPQALYLENVLPTVSGYQSVGFLRSATPFNVPSFIINCFEFKAKDTIPASTLRDLNLYVFFDGTYRAGPLAQYGVTFVGTAFGLFSRFSYAVVRDVCYLLAYNSGPTELYTVTFDGINVIFTNITATVTPANFLDTFGIGAICGSNNYLICHNRAIVYYSSTTTSTDFVSSLVTGAGSIAPNNADSVLNFIRETDTGFIVYTEKNAITAQYTGNARYPWKFTPVISGGPVYDPRRQVYGHATSGYHFVIENDTQLKAYRHKDSKPIAPEVTEFLQSLTVQAVYSSVSNSFTEALVSTKNPSIYQHLDRYLILSVNGEYSGLSESNNFTHAIVYDMALNRYGKLKVDHTWMFTVYGGGITEDREQLAFVDVLTNNVRLLHFDVYNSVPANPNYVYEPMMGVFLLGKLQYIRSKLLQLEQVEIEGPPNTAVENMPNFSCRILPSLDGRNFNAAITPFQKYFSGGVAKYNSHVTAINHSILLKGAFDLSTIECKFVISGER